MTLQRMGSVRLPLLGIAISVIYSLTAQWGSGQNVDAVAAALPAWKMATKGTVVLNEHAGTNPWLVKGRRGWVSDRPPGISAVAVPFYLLARPFSSGFTFWPATAAAILLTTIALLLLVSLLADFLPHRLAIGGTLLFAFGTATWPISGTQLWPHGVLQLWAMLAMLALRANRQALAGVSCAAMLLTRPPAAMIAATMGTMLAIKRRSIRPLLAIGIPSLGGLLALLAYNRLLFGSWSVLGGYSPQFVDRLTGMPISRYLANVVGMFFHPHNGVVIWSPFLLVLLPGLGRAWKSSPDWVKAAALGGLSYIVLHARLNRVSGGLPFDYRYQLEMLTLAAPLLALCYQKWVQPSGIGRWLLVATGTISVVLQGLNAVALSCAPITHHQAACSFF